MSRTSIERTAIKRLFGLSGNLCAFPGCSKRMVEGDGTVVGQICHIEAAEVRGERYNENQTDKERNSFENLMLLCKHHHEETNDVAKYTVDILRKMKAEHEAAHSKNTSVASDEVIEKFAAQIENHQQNVNNGSGMINAPLNGNVIVNGMSTSDGILLFRELFEANMTKLQREAAKVAERRVEELYESFAQKAAASNLTKVNFEHFREPEVQSTLTTAIKTAATREEPVIRENLAELLVKKLQYGNEDLKRIVLSESISTIGKLTVNHIYTMSLAFVVSNVVFKEITSWDLLNQRLDSYVKPFLDLKVGAGDLQHIGYSGCGIINYVSESSIESLLGKRYPTLFCRPIVLENESALSAEARSFIEKHAMLRDGGYRFSSPAMPQMGLYFKEHGVSGPVSNEIINLIGRHQLPIRQCVIENVPIGDRLFHLWEDTGMKHLALTSVGMAIAISMLEQVTRQKLDLNHWFS